MTDNAGNLVSYNYQYEYNGLLLGSGTKYKIETVEGLRTLPKISTRDRNRQGRHGAIPGPAYYRPRTLSWDMWVLGSAHTLDLAMDELGGAFVLTDNELPFVFQRPQLGKRRLWARVSAVDIETGYDFAMGKGECSIELTATDPFYYSNKLRVEDVNIDSGSSSAQVTVTNYGKVRSERLVLVVRGPVSAGTTIQNVADSNRGIRLKEPLDTDERLEIDVFYRTANFYADLAAYEAGEGEVWYNFAREDNQWWSLLPGDNLITINRLGSTGTGNLEVQWRDAWVV